MKTKTLPIGQAVRYRPGTGTYGYEDVLEADGRVPGIVVGHTPTRVRVRMRCNNGDIDRSVDAASLMAVEHNAGPL